MVRYFAAYAEKAEDFDGQNLNVGATYSSYEEAVKAKERYKQLDLEEGADESGPINIFEVSIRKIDTIRSCCGCLYWDGAYCAHKDHGPFVGWEETKGGCECWQPSTE